MNYFPDLHEDDDEPSPSRQLQTDERQSQAFWFCTLVGSILLLGMTLPRALLPLLQELLLAFTAPAVVLIMLLLLARCVPMQDRDDESEGELELIMSPQGRTPEDIKEQVRSYTSSQDDVGECCDICQEDYCPDEIMAESKNADCMHRFHLRCITEWLIKNEECPICRRQYLMTKETDMDQPRDVEPAEGSESDLEANVVVVNAVEEEEITRTRRRR